MLTLVVLVVLKTKYDIVQILMKKTSFYVGNETNFSFSNREQQTTLDVTSFVYHYYRNITNDNQ